MALEITHAEIFGRSEDSLTVAFDVRADGRLSDAGARVALDGEVVAECGGEVATRHLRIEGLEPGREYALDIRAEDGSGPAPDPYLPERVSTLPTPDAALVASFATMNDLHFGEPYVGGVLSDDMEYSGETRDGFPMVREGDTDIPYWSFMNDDAIAEINASGVDAAVVKGDIADRGLRWQFERAADAFSKFAMPHHAFLGNHDYLGPLSGEDVDGYALLGQPRAPRAVDLGGWRLVLLDTCIPGEHHGVFPADRRSWLDTALRETRETGTPTLLFTHHQPVPPEHAESYPNTIGITPADSLELFDVLAPHPQVKGILIGHTHRNRVRRYRQCGALPFIEVNCTKDYPGGWAHYRLFEDGSFRQEVRRTGSARALTHSTRCRDFYNGFYRHFALGTLDDRSFEIG